MHTMSANELRRGFLSFFEQRGHTIVPSASLIPHDRDLLFTVAGMVPFKPYFLGEQTPPHPRVTTVQKCLRAGGKDSDLEEVGRDGTHLSFFEMLGNFSFGDYFKAEAIPMAWDMITNLFGLDPDRLWVTVHVSDDEAEAIWRDEVGVRPERIQRLEADNWWGPPGGPPGPCGPSSEIFVDRGEAYGADGGPAHNDVRYVEIWNLVFMQFNRDLNGVDHELPRKNIDTGAGLDRILAVLQGVDSVWEIDTIAPILDTAQSVSGHRLGESDRQDVSLRIMAEHARAVSFLVADGVFPSNEGRGYVLRRIIRRLVRHAYLLDVQNLVSPELVRSSVEVMGEAYPELVANRDFITNVVVREEERFRQTLKAGLAILSSELGRVSDTGTLPGSVAFVLHDTHGFPLELTEEIAGEADIAVDHGGFDEAMARQRADAIAARKDLRGDDVAAYQELYEQFGSTEFTGREEYESAARVIGLIGEGETLSIVLDRTPFYAESGGQVGDTGTITTPTGKAEVLDTVPAVGGQMTRHKIKVAEGEIRAGEEAVASIDGARRDAIRRNHTATHLLHWALREVLGDHVKQQGSYVDDERLRFDFSHYEAMTPDEIVRVEDLVNADTLANHPARHFETTKDFAMQMGAIAFFGDKYGDTVRVLEAGPHSTELCGGTHVRALGDIGAVKIVSESSIGSNLRRIEAISGFGPIQRLRDEETLLARVAGRLGGVALDEIPEAIDRRVAEVKELQAQNRALRQQVAAGRASGLMDAAVDGVVVARVDALPRDDLRNLALAVRDKTDVRGVVLGGEPEGGGATLVAAVRKDSGLDAGHLITEAKKTIGGGGGPNPEIAMAGGKNAAGIDEALDQVRAAAGIPTVGSTATAPA
jgi:alanyl-tRNA synthetase